MEGSSGRAPSGTGSREPDQQAVPALSGFDPSRVAASLSPAQARALLDMPFISYSSGHSPGTLVSLKHGSGGTNYGVPRPALCSATFESRCSKRYVLTPFGERVVALLRDSARNPEGGDGTAPCEA